MKNAMFPLKYPLRILSVLQLITLAYFWWTPSSFPYSIARHSEEIMTIGYVMMLATPVMLAMGYYILNQGLAGKIFHTLLILAFLAVMVPHQVLAQAFLMQHFSVLFMPIFYICFGAVFDALVFVALYSWVVSKAPASATI
jgi:small-conductance mechanosensitive channel